MPDRPNFLVIMSDEHGPMWSRAYGHPFVRTPNMERLAEAGATFDAAYCNAPLCVPSRLSFMTGRYVSNCEGWDNEKPLPSDVPTWPYLLRSVGYDSVLSGKMHLIGLDNLHGFREQIAVDPKRGGPLGMAVYGGTPIYAWDDGIPTADEPWMPVKEARSGTSHHTEDDDAMEAAALAYLRDPSRLDQPWALCVGFHLPHFPLITPEPYFSMYYPEHADLPNNPPGHLEDLPPAASRLRQAFGFWGYTDEEIRRARASYYGLITYLDDKIGRLLDALDEQGLAENTVVIYTADHGESLGEHGLWRKMNFYEQAARVPLHVVWPGVIDGGQRFGGAVTLVDLVATMLEMAGLDAEQTSIMDLDGASLLSQMTSESVVERDEAFVEHLAHGTDRPRAMVRRGQWKLCYSHSQPPELELYDLESDPGEFNNLAGDPAHSVVQQRLTARVMEAWGDPDELNRRIRNSQRSRLMIRQVLGDAPVF